MADAHVALDLPRGQSWELGAPGAELSTSVRVHDDDVFRRILLRGEVGFGEAYVDGLWDCDDLVVLLRLGLRNRARFNLGHLPLARLARLAMRRQFAARRNSREGSRQNIRDHYDTGNDFFSLILDETMGYSCPVYLSADDRMADAHAHKYQRLCEKAGVRSSDHLLEIGTGWGGFAIHAARTYGCRVTSLTLSGAQVMLARERVKRAGVDDLVDIRLCDYRDAEGRYDRIFAIEMLEHVGFDYYEIYFAKLAEMLVPGGRVAIQVIAMDERHHEGHRGSVSWIQRYIYPGACLPSLSLVERSLHESGLRLSHVEEIGQHYPRALREWRGTLLERREAILALGYDEAFVRKWEYYFATSEACFLEHYWRDVQLILDKPAREPSEGPGRP